MRSLLLAVASWWNPDLVPVIGVEAAYVLHTTSAPAAPECCCQCVNGVITHGDGHKTPCPCPPDCKCKRKGADCHCSPKK
jgi:hypothetical protein